MKGYSLLKKKQESQLSNKRGNEIHFNQINAQGTYEDSRNQSALENSDAFVSMSMQLASRTITKSDMKK